MKVTTIDIATPGNAIHKVGTRLNHTRKEHPTLEAAQDYIDRTMQEYRDGDIKWITTIETVEDDDKAQFLQDSARAIAAFGNYLSKGPDHVDVGVRKVNGIWVYEDSYTSDVLRATVKVTEQYGHTYK